MKEDGNSRILRTIPLMLIVVLFGSFAYGNVIYVEDDAIGVNDGTNWADAYVYLQDDLAEADEVLLLVMNAPAKRLAAARINLSPALQYMDIEPISLEVIRAFTPNGQEVPFQLLPDGDFDPVTNVAGTALFNLPNAGDAQLRLEFTELEDNHENFGAVTVRTQHYEVTHNPTEMACPARSSS